MLLKISNFFPHRLNVFSFLPNSQHVYLIQRKIILRDIKVNGFLSFILSFASCLDLDHVTRKICIHCNSILTCFSFFAAFMTSFTSDDKSIFAVRESMRTKSWSSDQFLFVFPHGWCAGGQRMKVKDRKAWKMLTFKLYSFCSIELDDEPNIAAAIKNVV